MSRGHRFPPFVMTLVCVGLTASVAFAAADPDDVCEGVTNKDWLFSLLGTGIGTIVLGVVGLQTLARSLASSGYRQSSANLAGLGLGALLGGGCGAGVMAARLCGVATPPGYVGVGVSALGLVILLFSVVTGKSGS